MNDTPGCGPCRGTNPSGPHTFKGECEFAPHTHDKAIERHLEDIADQMGWTLGRLGVPEEIKIGRTAQGQILDAKRRHRAEVIGHWAAVAIVTAVVIGIWTLVIWGVVALVRWA